MTLSPEAIKEYQECFAILDKDQDKMMTLEEVKAVLKIVQPAMDAKETKLFLEGGPIDAKCDENTFRTAMVKKITAPHSKQELLDAFKIFDPEGKGKMGVDEITPILSILGE